LKYYLEFDVNFTLPTCPLSQACFSSTFQSRRYADAMRNSPRPSGGWDDDTRKSPLAIYAFDKPALNARQ